MKISVLLILSNNEKTIIDCLNSINNKLKDLNYEIVYVMDSRSNDNTRALIYDWWMSFDYHINLKSFEYNWETNSYADARNFALSKCSGDWILWVDGDERLISFQIPNPRYDYYFGCINNVLRGIQTTGFFNIRLFKNFPGVKWKDDTHETLDWFFEDKKQGQMDLRINHYGYYDLTKEQLQEKAGFYLERLLKDFLKSPKPQTKFYIAQCYYELEQWAEVIYYGALTFFDRINIEAKAKMFVQLYNCYKMLGMEHLGLIWLEHSVNVLPEQVISNYTLYDYYKKLDNKEKQLEYLNNINQTIKTGSRMSADIPINAESVDARIKELQNAV